MRTLSAIIFGLLISFNLFAVSPVNDKLQLWLDDSTIPEDKGIEIGIQLSHKENYAHLEDLKELLLFLDDVLGEGYRNIELSYEPSVKTRFTKSQLSQFINYNNLEIKNIYPTGALGTLYLTQEKIEEIQNELFKIEKPTAAQLKKAHAEVLQAINSEFDLKHDLNTGDKLALAAVLIDKEEVRGKDTYPSSEWIEIALTGSPDFYRYRNILDRTYSQGQKIEKLKGLVAIRLRGLGYNGPDNYGWLYRYLPEKAGPGLYLLARRHPSQKNSMAKPPYFNGDWKLNRLEDSPDYSPLYELELGEDLIFEDVAPGLNLKK
jgi:hypothetical protein